MSNDPDVRSQLQAAWADVVNRLNIAVDPQEITALTHPIQGFSSADAERAAGMTARCGFLSLF